MLLDPGTEHAAIECPIDSQRCHELDRAHGSQESRVLPATATYALDEPHSTLSATIGACHVRLSPRFVEEHDSVRIDV